MMAEIEDTDAPFLRAVLATLTSIDSMVRSKLTLGQRCESILNFLERELCVAAENNDDPLLQQILPLLTDAENALKSGMERQES
jgi:hypothetical protein